MDNTEYADRARRWWTCAVFIAVVLSLMAIVVTHADASPIGAATPFLDAVQEHTDCGANGVDCVQTRRQIRSLIAFMATAICTIAAATATGQKSTAVYGTMAGITVLKGVCNQFMYITNGDLLLPLVITVVAGLCAIAAGVPAWAHLFEDLTRDRR